MKRRIRPGLLIYAILILSMASCGAWQVHSAPYDCSDGEGHGPDPGPECDHAIAYDKAHRPAHVTGTFIFILLLGGLGLGFYGALRLSLRIDIVRRFAEGDDPWP